MVVGTSSVLLFPEMEKKEFCEIRLLLKGDPVWSAFRGWKSCTKNQCSESKRPHIGWSPAMWRSILEGRKARVALLSINAFGVVSFHWFEYTLQLSHFKYLVGDVFVKAVLLWLYELAMCGLSLRWKRRISHANQTSLLRRARLKWLSSHLKCLYQNIAERGWGRIFFMSHNYWKCLVEK